MSNFWERKLSERIGHPVVPTTPTSMMSYPPTAPPPPPVIEPPGPPEGQMRIGDAIHLWQGGPAAKQETDKCPACHSANYFSRSNGMVRGHAPAPHCYECGYPVVQFSSELGAGGQAMLNGG